MSPTPKAFWSEESIEQHSFLAPLRPLFESSVRAFSLDQDGFNRLSCEGIATLTAELDGRTVAVVYHDFRVNGGSFARRNSRRLNAFFEHVAREEIPLVMVFNTIGVGVMEGRATFDDAFGTIPALFDLRQKHIPLFTIAAGRCLGLGAILFQMGHYRIGVREKSAFNLTGPEVMRLFFGEGVDFNSLASAETQREKNDLVQEVADSLESALGKVRRLLRPISGHEPRAVAAPEGEWIASSQLHKSEENLRRVVGLIGSGSIEVLDQLSPVVRTFLVQRGGRRLGVFINPPGHPNNMINLECLRKYQGALAFFKALRVPVVSLLDTPGVDPRFEQQHQDIIREMVAVGKRIIQYPHGHMGIVLGRCFGGAATLGFPKSFRSVRFSALKDSRFGIMSESILEELLKNTPRLLAARRAVRAGEKADFSDLLEMGTLDAIITEEEIGEEIDRSLALLEGREDRKLRPLAPPKELPAELPRPILHRRPRLKESLLPRVRPRIRVGAPARSPHLRQKYSP